MQELRGSTDVADSDASTLSSGSMADGSSCNSDPVSSGSERITRAKTAKGRSTRSASRRSRDDSVEEAPKQASVSSKKSLKFTSNDDRAATPSSAKRKSLHIEDDEKPASPIIPGFGKMNVKAKAHAFEEFANTTLNESLNHSSSETRAPRSKGTPASPRKHTSRTPRACQLVKETERAESRATVNLSGNKTPTSSATTNRSCKITVKRVSSTTAKRGETRRSSVRGSLSSIRKSLSKRRSSLLRTKTSESKKPTGTSSVSRHKQSVSIKIYGTV